MDDDYQVIKKKPLKLKKKHTSNDDDDGGDSGKNKKLRKEKSNQIDQDLSHLPIIPSDPDKVIISTQTKAEQAFKSKQDKIAEERILKKAAKTHKQRVEEFNKHLDSLSEHYDIPKVSWTK